MYNQSLKLFLRHTFHALVVPFHVPVLFPIPVYVPFRFFKLTFHGLGVPFRVPVPDPVPVLFPIPVCVPVLVPALVPFACVPLNLNDPFFPRVGP